MVYLIIGVIVLLVMYAMWKEPVCPKCKSNDIGIFIHHDKQVFTCYECGHKDDESKL
jgi:transposase-like protein